VGGAALPTKAGSQPKGVRRDYKRLAQRARELMEAQGGLTRNAAADLIAEQEDLDNAETVARGIRRHLREARPSARIDQALRPGLGILLPILEKRLKVLEIESADLLHTEEQYEPAAKKAELIRAIIEKRLGALRALDRVQRTAQAAPQLEGLDQIDPSMEPAGIVGREIEELGLLLLDAKRVQDVIAWRRPQHTHGD
jgi:hypothetical protein